MNDSLFKQEEPSMESVIYPTHIVVQGEEETMTTTTTAKDVFRATSSSSLNTSTSNTTTHATIPPKTRIPIHLTLTEQKLVQLFSKAPPPMQFRLAGGWVRDKLLQKQSHDIDVAVEHATGVQAAEWVVSQHNPPHVIVSSLGIVAANPEQSKHLETAVLKLFQELDVDFVPLRCAEVYSDPHSRIPQQTLPGTPYQDAMRRDFTLNALFFNVHSQCIEDWTGRGITDLQRGVLVTPLNPVVTLQDDPLRLLRGLRFAVRYSFVLDPAFENVAQQPYMKELLQTKVSRERIGKECMGMWQADAITALHKMNEWNIASVIFQLPPSCFTKSLRSGNNDSNKQTQPQANDMVVVDDTTMDTAWSLTKTYLQAFAEIIQVAQQQEASTISHPEASPYYHKIWTPVAAFLLPFRNYSYQDEKQKSTSVITYIMRNSLKAKNLDVQCVTTLFETMDMALELLLLLPSSNIAELKLDRLKVGRFVKAVKTNWVSSLYLAATVWCCTKKTNSMTPSITTTARALAVTRLIQAIYDAQLHEAWTIAPLLSGKQMMQALQLKPGPMIGEYQQKQLEFQFQFPNGTVDECLEYLQSSTAKRPKQGE